MLICSALLYFIFSYRYMVRVQVMKTTGNIVAETCFLRSGQKMCNLRDDSLAQLLTYANVHAYQQVLVHETCMGVVIGLAVPLLLLLLYQ